MSGLARLDAPGVLHHLIVRGIERRKTFIDNQDRDNFLDRLTILFHIPLRPESRRILVQDLVHALSVKVAHHEIYALLYSDASRLPLPLVSWETCRIAEKGRHRGYLGTVPCLMEMVMMVNCLAKIPDFRASLIHGHLLPILEIRGRLRPRLIKTIHIRLEPPSFSRAPGSETDHIHQLHPRF